MTCCMWLLRLAVTNVDIAFDASVDQPRGIDEQHHAGPSTAWGSQQAAIWKWQDASRLLSYCWQ